MNDYAQRATINFSDTLHACLMHSAGAARGDVALKRAALESVLKDAHRGRGEHERVAGVGSANAQAPRTTTPSGTTATQPGGFISINLNKSTDLMMFPSGSSII